MRKFLLAALAIISIGVGAGFSANYLVTQGTGTSFGSLVIGGVNYAQQAICDPTTPSQCVAVNSSSQIAIQAPPTLPLPAGAATSALQSTINTTLGSPMQNSGGTVTATQASGANLHVNVDNTNANGQASAAASSPVVLPAAQVTADPCTLNTKTNITISTTATSIQLAAGSGSTQVYICSFSLIAATAAIIDMVGGTGATCASSTPIAIWGSTTAANGLSLAANGGLTYGNGAGTVGRTTTAGHGACLQQSGSAQISGNAAIVQQ